MVSSYVADVIKRFKTKNTSLLTMKWNAINLINNFKSCYGK